MTEISAEVLISIARKVVKPKKVGEYLIGDVGCALVTDTDTIYTGVCIDTGSGMGFCAEHSAIATMVTAGEYKIRKIVAVWVDDNKTHILAPCGRCREFISQIHPNNLFAEVVLAPGKVVILEELLPHHGWSHVMRSRSP